MSGTADKEQVVDAALGLIEREGWRGLTMPALARAADVPLSHLYEARLSKTSLLKAFIRRIDLAALEDADADSGAPDTESPRDRLFDAVMLRFEAMEPYREAMRVLVHDLPRDPVSAAGALPQIRTSLRWTLESAGFGADGVRGALRVRLLGLICWRTLRVWLDDGEDLARTMADLDRRLRKAGRWLVPEGRRTRSENSTPETGSEATPEPGEESKAAG